MIEAAIDVARDIAADDTQMSWIATLEQWMATEVWPGIDLDFEKRFPTIDEQRFWAQAFHSVSQRIYHRNWRPTWGSQDDQTWQVQFITACQLVSLMLTSLVWKVDRQWYPEPKDADGIRPEPIRIQY